MANKRKIILFFSSEGQEKPFDTNIRTFGELIQLVPDYNLSSKKVVDSASRVTYETDEAILPEGDCVLYVYNKKSKAGVSVIKKAVPKEYKKVSVDKLHTFPIDFLRKLSSYLNRTYDAKIGGKGTKDVLMSSIRKWMITHGWPESLPTGTIAKESVGAHKLEGEVKGKIKGGIVRADIGEEANPVTLKSVKKGAATLDIISDKLDLVIEMMGIKQGIQARPVPSTSEQMKRDAAELKEDLFGVK